MGRKRTPHPVAKIPVSISVDLHDQIDKCKRKDVSFDQILTKIFSKYLWFQQEYPFLQELYDKATERSEEYCQIMENCPNCKPKLTEIQHRPSRKTTAAAIRDTSILEGEFKTVEQWLVQDEHN